MTDDARMRTIFARYKPDTLVGFEQFCLSLELCQTVRDLPGDVIECGVWKGGMIAGIAEWLGPDRHYYLADSFEGLPPADPVLDGQRALDWQASGRRDNCRAPEAWVREVMARTGIPAERIHILAGWFCDTLPALAGGPRFAVLRLDCDWWVSTVDVLNALWGNVIQGGVVIIDDYYGWQGCGRAVRCFCRRNGLGEVEALRGPKLRIAYLRKAEDRLVVPVSAADYDAELDR